MGEGSSFPRSLSLRSVSPHENFSQCRKLGFFEKNEWTDLDLNRRLSENTIHDG